MSAQLQKEAEEDAETYESMACWCETGDKQKAKAIADGKQTSSELGATIEELTSKSLQLKSDIETLEASVAEQTTALSTATAIRDKEKAEFVAEEKEMIQSITSLKGAVITLSKTHGESALLQVKDLLKHQSKKHHRLFSLIQQRTSIRASTLAMQTTPASGEIYGILKQMKEQFETSLATS